MEEKLKGMFQKFIYNYRLHNFLTLLGFLLTFVSYPLTLKFAPWKVMTVWLTGVMLLTFTFCIQAYIDSKTKSFTDKRKNK